MSDTDQLIPEDLDDDEPLRAELRLCFVGSSGIVKEPPFQLQHAQDVQLGREKSCSLWIEDSVVSELHASVHPQLTEKGFKDKQNYKERQHKSAERRRKSHSVSHHRLRNAKKRQKRMWKKAAGKVQRRR